MKSKIKITLLSFFLLISAWGNAGAIDLHTYISKMTLGEDPGEPDTIYAVCSRWSATEQVIQIRMKSDNTAHGDSISGMYMPLVITTDKPGVLLDTSIAATYSGTALEYWGFPIVSLFTPYYPGDPSYFPMHALMGGGDWGDAIVLPFGKGDHLIANLVFNISEPTKFVVDTTSNMSIGRPLEVATTSAYGYTPMWKGCTCEQLEILGDLNRDYDVNLSDVVYLLNYLFGKPGNSTLKSVTVADFNCDGHVLLSDLVSLINLVFKSQPIPCKL